MSKNGNALVVSSSLDNILDNEGENKYLILEVGEHVLALQIDKINEILEYENVTHIPMVPAYIHGVINLRGSVVPIIDLAKRLNLEGRGISKKTCLIMLQQDVDDETIDIGIVVDLVRDVIDIEKDMIEPAPAFGADIDSEYILGMGNVNNHFVVLLNVDKALSISDLSNFMGELA